MFRMLIVDRWSRRNTFAQTLPNFFRMGQINGFNCRGTSKKLLAEKAAPEMSLQKQSNYAAFILAENLESHFFINDEA